MPYSLADLLNSPCEYEYEAEDGKKTVYRFRQATLEEWGEYQRWLESEARASAARSTDLPEEDRRNLLRDANTDIACQTFAWGGEACVKSLRTPQGFARLLTIVCRDQRLDYRTALAMAGHRLKEIARLVLDVIDGDEAGDPEKKKILSELLRLAGLPQSYFAPPSSPSATAPTESPPTSSNSAS